MELFERDAFLDDLHKYLREAAAGEGRYILLSGEVGIGKTALVERFCHEARSVARVAIASCDSLTTPGALAPLIQFAPALGLPLGGLLEAGATADVYYQQIFAALVNAPRPTILVGEDAHVADEGSLNMSRFLVPRIGRLRALFIITYRDDSLEPCHPLRILLGDIATAPAVRRMTLPRLSFEAVRAMAVGHDVDAEALYDLTSGNPFFVTEVLASEGTELPATVRDAVLARAARLSPEARSVLDAAAVIGKQFDPDLLDAIIGGPTEEGVEECLTVGMLRPYGERLAFRHGVARFAILEAMSPAGSRALNRRALAILEQRPAPQRNPAQLAHHAELANEREAALTYALAAARQSSALRAHWEAASQYERALRCAGSLPADQRADLLECRSEECHLTGLVEDAIDAGQTALELRRETGDRRKEGDALCRLSRLWEAAGRHDEADRVGGEALAVLLDLPPGPELARALTNQAQLRARCRDIDEAIAWGERAIALAEQLGDIETLIHALTSVGTTKLSVEDEAGRALLERSLALARGAGYDDEVARALTNLARAALSHFQLPLAEEYLADGIRHTTAHDFDALAQDLLAMRARLRLVRGDWPAALDDAGAVERHPAAGATARVVALTVLGRVRARLGRGGETDLDEALALAERVGDQIHLSPVRAARAEAAWLAGDATRAAEEARAALDLARRDRDRWLVGELALALCRAGERDISDEGLAEPFALQVRGEWQAAAACWDALGCPVESARALTDGDEAALRRAWSIFDGLGARVDAMMATRRLREMGAHYIPRGPRPATRANPALLTPRELEILGQVVERKNNREIADHLVLSPRTVGHHVSSILGKLGVQTRSEAARAAIRLNLFQDR